MGNRTGPLYCTQQVWFADSGTKAGNAAATGAATYPSWDTTAPTTSVQGGAGGGFLTTGVGRQMAPDPQTDAATGVDSGPDVVHDIRLFFSAYGLVSATGVVVYDTTEVPGGITFNAAPLPEGLVTVPAG